MTDRYGVIGNPVAHSKSPEIHSAFAREFGLDILYERVLAPVDKFASTVIDWRDANSAAGANVTLPFKMEAFALAREHTARARRSGAVNTLKFDGDMIIGDNTDGAGLCRDIVDNLAFQIYGKRVLLLGAGGAARGVAGALADGEPALLAISNRTYGKAEALAAHLAVDGATCSIQAFAVENLPSYRFDLIINATSSSLNEDLPLVPPDCFEEGGLAYDMMYGMGDTPFLKLAASRGARTADGLGMLVEQAAESFLFWRGLRPSTAPVLDLLRGAQDAARSPL